MNFKDMEPKQRKITIITAIIILALIVISVIAIVIVQSNKNNAGKIAGNLNNNGFAYGKGNKIYISNTILGVTQSESENGIYELNSKNESKLVTTDELIYSINYYKGNLYYLAMNIAENGNYIRQVVKVKPNGKNKEIVVDNIETTLTANNSLSVNDGWIFYLNSDSKIEKIKINGDKRQQVADDEVERFQISGKYIYYTTKDDEFKRMKKDGSNNEKLENGIASFQVVGNDVYYISQANGHLMKWNIENHVDTEIVDKKVKTFNIYEKTIYYAINEMDEQAIYKRNLKDNKSKKLVDLANANVHISVAGKWIYYTDQVEGSPYYFTFYKVNKNGGEKQAISI